MDGLIEEYIELNEENDLFNTMKKANAIKEFLELENNSNILSKNNMIALYGEWGSGKSSVMYTIQQNIDKGKYETIWFDTWKYEKDEKLPYALFKYIVNKGNISNGEKILRASLGVASALFVDSTLQLPFMEINTDPKKFRKRLKEEIEKNKCLWEEVKDFEDEYKKIKPENKEKLIVFLDDLDRCESYNIISLISSIKNLLSINENIIFVLGIDKKAVTLALQNKYGNDYNKATEYLEKIFPINFELSSEINNIKFNNFVKNITGLNDDDVYTVIDVMNRIDLKKPRHIKKVLRKYYFIKEYLRSKEVDINNKYCVSFVIYLITLGYFYPEDYKNLFIDRNSSFEKIILYENYRSDEVFEYPFNKVSLRCRDINEGYHILYDIMPMLKQLSPCYSIDYNTRLQVTGTRGSGNIYYSNWRRLFSSNISLNFIDYIIKNDEYLAYFYEDNVYRNEEINKLIITVDNVL